MKGKISELNVLDTKVPYGFILGDDGKKYYFNADTLIGILQIEDIYVDDYAEFSVDHNTNGAKYEKAIRVQIIKNKRLVTNASGTMHFHASGISPLIDLNNVEYHLKEGSGDLEIIKKLGQVLYISRIDHHIFSFNSKYPFCLAGSTRLLQQYIREESEFLIIFSHFDNCSWQQKTLLADREIRKRREIADRRPLLNFYILISNATNLIHEVDSVKGGTTAAVIPFTYDEILLCKTELELSDLVLKRFSEYFFENDMLGETSAIDDDNLLFGDRGKIADSIVARCHQMNNSGIFGLRRSGKSSVLNAVLRRLDRDSVRYVRIESRSALETLDSWKTALYDIARMIRSITMGVMQYEGEPRSKYMKRLNLNSTEEDYEKRAAACFVEDVKLYCKDLTLFVIAIDEIELITHNTAQVVAWKSIEAYSGFWGALRDCGCPLILCGVNSTINESGHLGDNPMYGRIINCADSSQTYLPSFTPSQTQKMLNILGGYSHLSFDNVYNEINNAFGGQPYAIRQFGSFAFGKLKDKREPNIQYSISKATVTNLLREFYLSQKGKDLCSTILQRLSEMYVDEYRMLKNLALSPEKYSIVQYKDISKIDHLEKYGLIEYDRSTAYIAFRINIIMEYIGMTELKDPFDMTNDERRRMIQDQVAECETKLKTYIRNYYTINGISTDGRKMIQNYINCRKPIICINKKATPRPDVNTCPFSDFFKHDLFILYFSSLKIIIDDNWSLLGNSFKNFGISQDKFRSCMDDLNAGRTDADHYDAEDTKSCPVDWKVSDQVLQAFIAAYTLFKKYFDDNNL